MKVYDQVKIARDKDRPTALDYINHCFTDFIELHGDRLFGDDGAVVGGLCRLGNMPVTVIGIQKGKDTKENIMRNFGQAHPEGYRKALRLMKQAEKFHRPVVCFVNTSGAYPGVGAEERGQGEAIAKNLFELSRLKTPIISIITGEGGSGGAIALATADRVWMLENSIYAVLSPEGFASILWKDGSRAEEAAEIMKITAKDLFELGVIEKVIDEVPGGAQLDFEFTANLIKHSLTEELPKLCALSPDELIEKRYNRFRGFGIYNE
ncbi:MAG: acetyl-CoA carboxylase carboxyltransferase subunit alpha [Eubacterium sp.]|nr:acetyl-CoA carboxylase carboxyltransferase subunit alpha [Eubacterium sp.]MCD8238578.1 acetyl-CoA carboxylase carboxyltransferase subunit alpha [Clostridiales bacterium]